MFGSGRVRAPVSLLIAGLLGLGLAGTAQVPALAVVPDGAGTHAAAATAPSDRSGGAGSTSAAGAPAARPSAPASDPSGRLPLLPKKFAAKQPHYTPAGCNTAAPRKGVARCDALVRTDTDHRVVADTAGPDPSALTPSDIQAAYRLPDAGQGRTVAVVDAGGYASAEDDLATFRAQFGLPACTAANGCFRKADQRGGTDYPADDPDWAEETALDLDAVSSACPQCHILLVEADSASADDLGTAAGTAVALGAKYVSNSYGIPGEDPAESALTYYEHPGVVMTASTGDIGNVNQWPASDPDVVAVGGTTLTRDASTARGWTESAWASGGSGCSLYEPQPDYQAGLATDCARKATADISADADPQTGLAIYDSLGVGGWTVVGGTSLSSPLVAAMYALAGAPVDGTNPATYPYADQGNHLFDVTQGSNGACGNVLCTAGTGWDGPTGLGTPNGVSALTMGPHGTVSGTVTESSGGAPVAGASVVLADAADGLTFRATTDAKGAYSVPVSTGTYQVRVSLFGYGTGTVDGVTVASGGAVTANVTLAKVPSQVLTGKVTDDSGHGWPLYAKITIDGYPGGAVFTDPKTGTYRVTLPDQADYTLHVTPVYPGYGSEDATVHLGTGTLTHDVALTADQAQCVAPGYAYPAQADFESWTGASSQHGWTVTNNGSGSHTWEFDDPREELNFTGGTGNFAAADPYDQDGAAEDTDLTSPAMDLTGQKSADLQFDAAYIAGDGTDAQAELSTDGGSTWTSVWQASSPEFQGHVDIPLTGAPGKKNVKVRFHYDGSGVSFFEVDTVTVGRCGVQDGSLVEGTVTDATTHQPLDGAVLTDSADPLVTTGSTATPDDTALSDGFYWTFEPGAGRHTVRTAASRYTTITTRLTAVSDKVVEQDIALPAGRLQVRPDSVSLKEELGRKDSTQVTLTNTGTAPLHVALHEQSAATGAGSGSAARAGASGGAPLQRIKGDYTTGPVVAAKAGTTAPKPGATPQAPSAASPAGSAWQRLTDYPEPIMDNAVATYQGRTYSVGGVAQIVGGEGLADAYVYDPATQAWSAIAPLPQSLEAATAGFAGGTLYVAGGWHGSAGDVHAQSTVYAYHPASDTWSRVADLPVGLASASSAVYDGGFYVIGGLLDDQETLSPAVYRYDPARNTWTRVADYPVPVQWAACAGLEQGIVCAGGAGRDADGHTLGLADTYSYTPGRNAWTRDADMPYTDWGGASSGGNGELQVVGGIVGSDGTNQAVQYDPVTGTWSALPNAVFPIFRGGGSGCGFTQVGGSIAQGFAFPSGNPVAQTLPGYGQCSDDDASWLTVNKPSVDIAPGHSVTVRVTADASALAAPGTYAATLSLVTDAPYASDPVRVTTRATAPASWSEITGAVTDAGTSAPLPGARVTVYSGTHAGCAHPLAAVAADAHGTYDVWLKPGAGTVAVTAAADGHVSATEEVRTARGRRSTAGLALHAS